MHLTPVDTTYCDNLLNLSSAIILYIVVTGVKCIPSFYYFSTFIAGQLRFSVSPRHLVAPGDSLRRESSNPRPLLLSPWVLRPCHSEGAKRLKNLAQDRLVEGSRCYHSNPRPLPQLLRKFNFPFISFSYSYGRIISRSAKEQKSEKAGENMNCSLSINYHLYLICHSGLAGIFLRSWLHIPVFRRIRGFKW